MASKLREECPSNNFGFNDSKINDFFKSQWQHNTKSTNYVIYRWFVVIVFITSLTVSLVEDYVKFSWKVWVIYLTRWGLLLNLLTYILAAILVTLHNYNVRFQNKMIATKRVPIVIQIYWILQSVTVTLALLITIVYWGFVHIYGTAIDGTNILNHIVNCVILIIDMFVIRHPHRISHMIYVEVLLVIFLIFSFISYKAGGVSVEYGDWGNAKITLLRAFFVLIAIAILHMCIYGLYNFRIWIYKQQQKRKNTNFTRGTVPTRYVSVCV